MRREVTLRRGRAPAARAGTHAGRARKVNSGMQQRSRRPRTHDDSHGVPTTLPKAATVVAVCFKRTRSKSAARRT